MAKTLPPLTAQALRAQAVAFAAAESTIPEPTLYGVTDGKTVGTHLEQKFQAYLLCRYTFTQCTSASGIDFPDLQVDMKVTSFKQPQSSCPFKNARQKIFGLGYSLLLFVYQKTDDAATRTSTLNVLRVVYVDAKRTGDYTMTRMILRMLEEGANVDDLIGLMADRNLLVDDVEARKSAEEILQRPPEQGYLTISNAYQWRLQYGRVIAGAADIDGIIKLRGSAQHESRPRRSRNSAIFKRRGRWRPGSARCSPASASNPPQLSNRPAAEERSFSPPRIVGHQRWWAPLSLIPRIWPPRATAPNRAPTPPAFASNALISSKPIGPGCWSNCRNPFWSSEIRPGSPTPT
jgi:hypothetical protein